MADLREATYTVAGGYDIHLKEAGSGPAVVFIHGSGPGASGASNFRLNADAFVNFDLDEDGQIVSASMKAVSPLRRAFRSSSRMSAACATVVSG